MYHSFSSVQDPIARSGGAAASLTDGHRAGGTLAVMAILLMIAVLDLLPETTFAQTAKRAFEIADFYRSQNVSEPILSPDGRAAVFSVERTDLPKGEKWSDLWTLDLKTLHPHQLTHLRKNDGHPRYSPDGKHLLFVSDREDEQQLYLMATAGGEALQLTHFPAGLWDAEWSPDGRWIVAVSEVYPECGVDGDCHEKIAKAVEDGPLSVHVADNLLYRHWTAWRDGKYTHLLLIDPHSGEVVRDLTPGAFDSPTFSLGDRGFDLSPEGTEICYVSNHDSVPATSTNADLWIVPLDGSGEAVNITAANHGHDGSPLYSPDGRWIAYLSQETPGYESDLYRLMLYDRRSGEIRVLTDRSNFDNWISDFRWAPDSKSIYFLGAVPARNAIFRIDLRSASIKEIHREHLIHGFSLTPDGKTIIYNQRAMDLPLEIYRMHSDGRKNERITFFNRELEEEVDLRPPEELWLDGAGDYKVHVLLIKPHGFDPAHRYPLILNVHGGPQGEWTDNWRGDWQVYPGKGYVIAMPNPTGSSGYGQDFTDAIEGDWGGRVYRDLMKVIDQLAQLSYVDSTRMGLMGWSFGGYMVMWMEGHTDRFKAAASMMGLFDLHSFYGATEELWFPEHDLRGTPWTSELYRKWSPSDFEAHFKTPCLVLTGEKDFRVPYTQSLSYFTALQRQGVPSRLVVFPRSGHWPSWIEMAFYYNEHLAWFAKYLGGGEAPYDREDFSRNLVFPSHK